ncbi:MAG: MFS transporter [Anaerolineae bacterium]|jgi:DHA3 family macrolide efflux protein-like MFS transporter|nr:MFS transporter [Anaerolineae bacterium]
MRDHEQNDNRWMVPFFTIWTGQAFSLLGSELVQFALIWWMTKTTGSATVLATASLFGLLPQVFIGPLAGTLVDRWDRRRVMMGADAVIALATGVIIFLNLQGVLQPWHIYGLMFVRAVGSMFHWPAMQASTSLMVPKEHLTRVAGINQTLNGIMGVLAPSLGALLVEALPLYNVLAIDVGTAMLAVVPLFFVAVPQPPRSVGQKAEPSSVWGDLVAGMRYVWHWPGLCMVLAMAMLFNLFSNPSFSLLPLWVTGHFKGGAAEFGLLQSVMGAGLLIGGVVLSVWGGFRRKIVTMFLGMIGLGIGKLLIGLAPEPAFRMALVGSFVVGFMVPMIDGSLFAMLQALVDPEMQGRVFMLTLSLVKAAAPLGLAIAGPLADRFGIGLWFILAAAVCGIFALVGFVWPVILHLEDGRLDVGHESGRG